jgi:hypothetical protein
MFELFKSKDEKEIIKIIDFFFENLAHVGSYVEEELNNCKDTFEIEHDELIGRLDFAFYHVQIYRLLAIIDVKTDNSYALKFGKVIGKKMAATESVGFGAFVELTTFMKNRFLFGSINGKEAIAKWIAIKVLEVEKPSKAQVEALLEYVVLINDDVDKKIESISSKFSLDILERSALDS